MEPPFTVSEYIASNPGLLDALCTAAMHDAETIEELVDQNVIKLLRAAGDWKKRWNHWGSRGCISAEALHENIDMMYISCEEEGV